MIYVMKNPTTDKGQDFWHILNENTPMDANGGGTLKSYCREVPYAKTTRLFSLTVRHKWMICSACIERRIDALRESR